MFGKVSFVVSIDNKLFWLFHTFGCKQLLSNKLSTSSAFATHGDAQGVNPVNDKTTMAFTANFLEMSTTRRIFYSKKDSMSCINFVTTNNDNFQSN